MKHSKSRNNPGTKILVVDDERVIASTLATILEYRGYETTTAYSGEEALQMACAFQPDCIVSDVMMGAMNGIEAATEILSVLPRCKVLFISGNAGYGDLLETARVKGISFEALLKPVPPPELLEKLAQILSNTVAQSERLTVEDSSAAFVVRFDDGDKNKSQSNLFLR